MTAIVNSIVNSDVGLVYGYRGKCLGQRSNQGRLYGAVLNVGGYCPGVCFLTGGYRSLAAANAFFKKESERGEYKGLLGGKSNIFLVTQFCRGVGEIFHLTLILFLIDGGVTGIRFIISLFPVKNEFRAISQNQ